MTPASSSNQDDVDRARAIADMHAQWRKLDEERSNPRLALERQITGALKCYIDAHGPITKFGLGSVSKRVAGAVLPKEPDHRPLREVFPPRERRLDWAVIDVPRWSWFRKGTHRLIIHVAPDAWNVDYNERVRVIE